MSLKCLVAYFAFVLAVFLLAACRAGVHAEVIDLEGTVKAVDVDARTVTIERKTPSGTKTLTLEVAKKEGDVADLKPGSPISFSYDPDLEIVTKIASDQAGSKGSTASSPKGKRVPGQRESRICRQVVQKLEEVHYLQPRINNDICSQMMEAFVDSLDPLKTYLRQEDIDDLEKKKRDLSGQINSGDLSAFYDVFNRYVARVSAQLPVIEKLIDAPHDFTVREFIEMKKESMTRATDDPDALDKWRRRIKYDLLVLKMQGVTGNEAKQKLIRRYTSFATRMHSMTDDELLEIILNSLVKSLDPQSSYMAGETIRNFEIGQKMQLDGIGAQLTSEDGYVTVTDLTPGGAAEKDGRLKPNDRIIGVGQGASGGIEDITDKSLNEAVGLIRGERGTIVRLEVLSQGRGAPKVYDITRSKIDLTNAEVRAEVLSVERPGDKPLKVGVIVISSFYLDLAAMQKGEKNYKSVVQDCKSLLEGFRLQNVDSVVLDVRNNGSGSLPAISAMVGLFIERGRVAQFKNRDGDVKPLSITDSTVAWSGPLVVLISSLSGGGVEIFAGAIQDHHRGLIVGDTSTQGRAASWTIMALEDKDEDGMMKILIQCFYRANGEGFQQRGVKSDVVLPSLTDQLVPGKDKQRGPLAFDRIPKAGFQPVWRENPTLISRLQRLSEARVKKSRDFQQLTDDIERYLEQQKAGEVSLVETEFMKAWQQGSKESAVSERKPAGITRDFYLDEVLAIAADLTKASGGK
jgi:carboxyl-terminal processing protease